MTDITDCLKHRYFKVEKGKPYCTHITDKCPHQDYSDTRPCQMYSSLDGWSDETIPRCVHPEVNILLGQYIAPHDFDIRARIRQD